MRGLLAVARREVAERRLVLAAAVAASLLPFAVPLVRGFHGSVAREAREMIAVVLGASFAAGLAIVLGASVIGRDLKEGRLGFYFSRPLSATAIWAGKLGGALFLALASAAVVVAPTLLFGGGRLALPGLPAWAPGALIVASAALLLLSQAAAITVRSRSAMLALDAAGMLIMILAAAALVRALRRWEATEALWRAAAGFMAVAVLALAAAGLAAIARGRVSGRAAHRAFSLTFWAIALTGLAGCVVYASWVLGARPADLSPLNFALPAPAGPWVVVDGDARGAHPVFLVDTGTGRSERAGTQRGTVVFSEDGRTAAWLEPAGSPAPYDLVTLRLSEPGARPERSRLSFSALPGTAILSPDGRRIGLTQGTLLTIFDIASGRALVSAKFDDSPTRAARGFFVPGNPERLRTYLSRETSPGDSRLDIFELDAGARSWTKTGAVEGLPAWFAFAVNRAGDRLLVKEGGRNTLRLVDARTGNPIAVLAEHADTSSAWPRFLHDGRIVFTMADPSAASLRVFTADGAPLRTIVFPWGPRIGLGGEVAPGKLVVAARGADPVQPARTLYLADVDAGEIRRIGAGLYPVTGWNLFAGQANLVPAPGAPASKLFYGENSLVRIDPATGGRRVLLGKE